MSLLFLSLLLFVLWAQPTPAAPSTIQKHSFKVDRVRNPDFKRRNVPRELSRAYQKYRMPIPQDLLLSLDDGLQVDSQTDREALNALDLAHLDSPLPQGAKNTIGKVWATPVNEGIEYISPVSIGDQTLNMALDSGSADLWVFSTELPALSTVAHQAYNPSLSPTFKRINGHNFSITYGDGTSASGYVGTDTVDVGGVAVTDQAVQLATYVSSAFLRDSYLGGVLGLGFSQLSSVKPVKPESFFENVMPSLAQPLFTVDLRKDAVGSFEFGFVDNSKYSGMLAWIRANTTKGFWQVSTAGFTVGNNRTRLRPAQAIIDTGTTLMLVSVKMADGYYRHVPGARRSRAAGGVTFPCNTTLPDFVVDVGGAYAARIRGSDINVGWFQDGMCFGGIQPTAWPFQVWGDVFFRSQFVVFHGGNRSLGMASHD